MDLWSRLSTQSLGRALKPAERAFADALEAVFKTGTHDFTDVAAELTRQKIAGPVSGRSTWTPDTLATELAQLNADLDEAYRRNGLGA
jgi:hypothetical protein